MPEGAEVAIMTERVRELLLNKKIQEFGPVFGKLKEKGLNDIKAALPLTVADVKSNGKLMWIEFQSDTDTAAHTKWWLIVTFGLVGGWYKNGSDPNTRLKIVCDDGTSLYFRDKLNFGSLIFTPDSNVFQKRLKERGYNLFDFSEGNPELTLEQFTKVLKGMRNEMNICDFLCTKQQYLSGIGNVLKCEILYWSKISPWRGIKTLTPKEIDILHYYTLEVCKRCYRTGGRTSNYSDLVKPEDCTFTGTQCMVYEKSEDHLGNKITREETPDKRTTYWVKALQV